MKGEGEYFFRFPYWRDKCLQYLPSRKRQMKVIVCPLSLRIKDPQTWKTICRSVLIHQVLREWMDMERLPARPNYKTADLPVVYLLRATKYTETSITLLQQENIGKRNYRSWKRFCYSTQRWRTNYCGLKRNQTYTLMSDTTICATINWNWSRKYILYPCICSSRAARGRIRYDNLYLPDDGPPVPPVVTTLSCRRFGNILAVLTGSVLLIIWRIMYFGFTAVIFFYMGMLLWKLSSGNISQLTQTYSH